MTILKFALLPLCLFVAAAFSAPLPAQTELPTVETPPPLKAEEFLPTELISGPSWKVEDVVTTDGLIETFVVTTPYGSWEALSSFRVPPRIRQAEALAQLDEVSKSDVFLSAVKNSVTAPINLISAGIGAPLRV